MAQAEVPSLWRAQAPAVPDHPEAGVRCHNLGHEVNGAVAGAGIDHEHLDVGDRLIAHAG